MSSCRITKNWGRGRIYTHTLLESINKACVSTEGVMVMIDITKKSQCRAAGGLVFLSGRAGLDENHRIVSGGIAAQTRMALRHLEGTLEERGLDRSHIIKANVFLSGKEYFLEFNRVYSEFFAGLELPARRTIVAELIMDDCLIEIDAVACSNKATE